MRRLQDLAERVAPRGGFARGVLALATGNAAGQLILLAVTPLMTRLYIPEQFGVLAVFTSIMGVTLVASSLRYEMAIPLPHSDRNASQLLMLALIINLATVGLVALIVLFFRHRLAAWTETPALTDLLWFLPIAVFTAGTYKTLNFWAVRNRDYTLIARTKISQSVANAAAQIVGGLAGLGALGLILGQIIGQSVGASRLAQVIELRKIFYQIRSSPLRTWALAKSYHRFPKYDVPASLVDSVCSQMPGIALAVIFGPAVAGFYLLAERILATPMSLLGQAVAQVLYGYAIEALGQGRLHLLAKRLLVGLMALIAVPSIVLFMFAEPLFVWVFGPPWQEAGLFAGWLIIGLAIQFVYSPLSMILMVTKGQRFNLLIHSTLIMFKLGAVIMGYLLDSPLIIVMGLSLSSALAYTVAIVLIMNRAKNYSIISNLQGGFK